MSHSVQAGCQATCWKPASIRSVFTSGKWESDPTRWRVIRNPRVVFDPPQVLVPALLLPLAAELKGLEEKPGRFPAKILPPVHTQVGRPSTQARTRLSALSHSHIAWLHLSLPTAWLSAKRPCSMVGHTQPRLAWPSLPFYLIPYTSILPLS